VVGQLIADGHLAEDDTGLRAERFEVAVGAERGWETSVFDHFRAVTTAIAAKANRPVASDADEVGGGTRSFLVHAGHPHAREVYELLAETRRRTREVWRRVADFNAAHPPPEDADRVTFYFGQNVVRGTGESPAVRTDAAPEAATIETQEG